MVVLMNQKMCSEPAAIVVALRQQDFLSVFVLRFLVFFESVLEHF